MTAAAGVTDTWRFRRIVITMIPILMALSLLEMGGGAALERFKHAFLDNPAIIILLPVMIGMGGNLGAIMASRIATRLHLGTLDPDFRDEAIYAHVIAVFALAGTLSVLVAVAVHLIGNVIGMGTLSFARVLLITVSSGLSLAVFVVVMALAVTLYAFRHGIDPDDVAIPIVTNTCDIMGVLILIFYALLYL